MGKIINKILAKRANNDVCISFEYFPPRDPKIVEVLFSKVERMVEELGPEFLDITWGAGGSTSELTIEIAKNWQYELGVEAQIHMTCTNQKREDLVKHIQTAKDCGIQNILCLRGDPPMGKQNWENTEGGLSHALDLVKLVRELHGDHFGIAVAGYPEGHPDGSYETDLHFLKEKCDAGADCVMTQLFYDPDKYLKFTKDAEALGIVAPILPGIMPIYKIDSWRRMCKLCKINIPATMESQMTKFEERQKVLQEDLAKLVENDPKKKEIDTKIQTLDDDVTFYGIQSTIAMCKYLMSNGVPYFHFYTLNMELSVKSIVEGLELLSTRKGREVIYALPWIGKSEGVISNRIGEKVRPVHWRYNWSSYIERTKHWKFNNGNSNGGFSQMDSKLVPDNVEEEQQPLFQPPAESYFLGKYENPKAKRSYWGGEQGHNNIQSVGLAFLNFFNQEKKMKRLPWIPRNSFQGKPLIFPKGLGNLVSKGLLIINCQHATCSRPFQSYEKSLFQESDGLLYQRAYIEFFCSPATFHALKAQLLDTKPASAWSYHATNCDGSEQFTNRPKNYQFPITWVVLANQPVFQPLVVDERSFIDGWRQEAFNLWLTDFAAAWGKDSQTYEFIEKEIYSKYYLVSLVDNQFISCEKFFNELFDKFEGVKAAAGNHN